MFQVPMFLKDFKKDLYMVITKNQERLAIYTYIYDFFYFKLKHIIYIVHFEKCYICNPKSVLKVESLNEFELRMCIGV